MIALLQRVTEARVAVNGELVATIGPGLLVFLGVELADNEPAASRLVKKTLNYRIFPDDAGRSNISLLQIDGELLVVPQFTLTADTTSGLRPGFATAATPGKARLLIEVFLTLAMAQHSRVQSGVFGAHMQVSLTNDGPMTFWLES